MQPLDLRLQPVGFPGAAAVPAALGRIFLQRFRRRVSKDCVVSLHGRRFQLALAGKSVDVQRDPDAPAGRPLKVEREGQPAGRAGLLDANANARSGRRCKPAGQFGL